MKKIRLLIADDHLIIRNGIKLMLKRNTGMEVIAEAGNGQEVMDYINNNPNSIDLVLMNIDMPIMNGIEATRAIIKQNRTINVLALTMRAELGYINKMIKAGALGYILKESGINELILAIKTVATGRKYYSNEVSMTLINSLIKKEDSPTNVLSLRETEVLARIAYGYTYKEVGNDLLISGRTVEAHSRNIKTKLYIRNKAEMIRYAIENNLTV